MIIFISETDDAFPCIIKFSSYPEVDTQQRFEIFRVTRKPYDDQRRIQNSVKHLRWSVFAKIANAFEPLIIFKQRFILDVWKGSEYVSGDCL